MLWRSAPPEIMMRLNAPISSFLAFAVLSLLPATLVARPAHRTAHKATTAKPAATKHAHGKAAASPTTSRSAHKPKHHSTGRLRQEETPSRPPTVNRVHASRHVPSTPAVARKAAPASRTDVAAQDSGAKKATSQDFLEAASGRAEASGRTAASDVDAEAPRRDKALAIKTPPSNDETAPSSHARSRQTASPATAVSVVNVIRETTARPQLESVEETAATPMILPTLYNKRGRLIVPPPLKGSREILLRQNQVADRDGLDRIQNDDDLIDMRNKRMLVALPVSSGLQVDEHLPANRRYSRPWTAQFLSTLARAHYARFRSPLQVNSAVRTVEFQQRLLRTNGNAAPAEGEMASPHLTGQAVDIAKHGLSLTEIAWLRGYLLPLVQEGKIDVEEEFQQACFHISVYKRYLPAAKIPPREIVTSHRSGTTALAAAIQ